MYINIKTSQSVFRFVLNLYHRLLCGAYMVQKVTTFNENNLHKQKLIKSYCLILLNILKYSLNLYSNYSNNILRFENDILELPTYY